MRAITLVLGLMLLVGVGTAPTALAGPDGDKVHLGCIEIFHPFGPNMKACVDVCDLPGSPLLCQG